MSARDLAPPIAVGERPLPRPSIAAAWRALAGAQALVVAARAYLVGEATIAHTLERYRAARDFLVAELNAIPGVSAAGPKGAMYVFFRVAGVTDSLEFCKRLVREVGLGLAPGSAFGPEGEGFVRWCFAADIERLADGVARLRRALGKA